MTKALKDQWTKMDAQLMSMRLGAIREAGMVENFLSLCENALKRTDQFDEYLELVEEWSSLDKQLCLERLRPSIEQRARDMYVRDFPCATHVVAEAQNRVCPCCEMISQVVEISDGNQTVAGYRVQFVDASEFRLIEIADHDLDWFFSESAKTVMEGVCGV